MNDDITFCPDDDDGRLLCDICDEPRPSCRCYPDDDVDDGGDDDRVFCDGCGVCVAVRERGVWRDVEAEHDEECGTRTYCDQCGVVVSVLGDGGCWQPVEHEHDGDEPCEYCPACALLEAERGAALSREAFSAEVRGVFPHLVWRVEADLGPFDDGALRYLAYAATERARLVVSWGDGGYGGANCWRLHVEPVEDVAVDLESGRAALLGYVAEALYPERPAPVAFDAAELAAASLSLALAAAAPATTDGMRSIIERLARKLLVVCPSTPAAIAAARDRLLGAVRVDDRVPLLLSVEELAGVGCVLAVDAACAGEGRRAELLPVVVALLGGDLLADAPAEPAPALGEADHIVATAAGLLGGFDGVAGVIDLDARRAALRPPAPMSEAEYAAEVAALEAQPERGAESAHALVGALGASAERCTQTLDLPFSGGDDDPGAA